MDEQEFDSLFKRPFKRADAMRLEGRLRRLAVALFGKTFDTLQRQLLAPFPEVPPSFDLADFQVLHQRLTQTEDFVALNPRHAWASRDICVGTQRFTVWEARREVVRRAIEYLERR
jgi:hypothetical protein